MKIINPNVEILKQMPGIEGIYKQIEKAGRTCYKSEDNITDDSAKAFVDRMINSGHLSTLEHGTVYLAIPMTTYAPDAVNKYRGNVYSKINDCNEFIFIDKYGDKVAAWCVTTNLRVLVENDCLEDLEFLCEPTEYHERRITMKFTTNIGVTREGNRHRVNSISEESTRFCNYSKDKFGNDITIVPHVWIDMNELDKEVFSEDEYNMANISYFAQHYDTTPEYDTQETIYFAAIAFSGLCYKWLIEKGWTPQQAREVLPLATKTDVVYTAFASDWNHFFNLRLFGETGIPHPNMKEVCEIAKHKLIHNDLWKLIYPDGNLDKNIIK